MRNCSITSPLINTLEDVEVAGAVWLNADQLAPTELAI
jgi:hypothetical protein